MMISRLGFNLYLCVGLAISCGCQSPEAKRKNEISTLRVHLEAPREAVDTSHEITISRSRPLPLRVFKESILDESYIAKAEVIEEMGGFRLRIQFDRRGSWLLEQKSAGNLGKHLAIYSEFPTADGQAHQSRWLAAPRIQRRISDGTLLFTPDATRQEAEQIALGLTNVAEKNDPR